MSRSSVRVRPRAHRLLTSGGQPLVGLGGRCAQRTGARSGAVLMPMGGLPRRATRGSEVRRGFCLRHAPTRASRRTEIAWATAARVAWVLLRGFSIMKSWVMPS